MHSFVIAGVLAAAAALGAAASGAGPVGPGFWTCALNDTFSALNASVWNVYNDTYEGVNQIELYMADDVWAGTAPPSGPGGVYPPGLHLRTRPRNLTISGVNYNITSGRVDTLNKFAFTYGRVEVRARLQTMAAYGIHSAIWLLGTPTASRPCWPVCAEIDVWEYEVEHSSLHADTARGGANYHFGHACGVQNGSAHIPQWPSAPPGVNPVNFTEPHVYAVEWNVTHLVMFVDGEQVGLVFAGMPVWPDVVIPSWPMYLLLSQAYMMHRPYDPPDWVWPVVTTYESVSVWTWAAAQDNGTHVAAC